MDLANLGPVEYALVAYPDGRIGDGLATELHRLTDAGVIHLIDLAFITRDAAGRTRMLELDDLDAGQVALFDAIDGEAGGLFGEEDLELVAEEIPAGGMGVLAAWEDAWVRGLGRAVRETGGAVLAHELVPDVLVRRHAAAVGG